MNTKDVIKTIIGVIIFILSIPILIILDLGTRKNRKIIFAKNWQKYNKILPKIGKQNTIKIQ